MLHLSIRQNEGINSVAGTLKLSNHDEDFISEIKSCIYFILKNNIFTFNEQNHIQISSTSVGTKIAPKYVNIFMAEMEKSLCATSNKLPMRYFRFLDDIFIIWISGQESSNEYLNLAGDFYPSIKFTIETSKSEIHFLNTTINLQKNKVHTKIYIQPVDIHLYFSK